MDRRKFLVGVDGSPPSLAALRCAADLISSKEDELLLLTVYENHISSELHVEPGVLEEESKVHNRREAAAHTHLDEALSEAHKIMPRFNNIHGILRGSPAVGETITKIAQQEGNLMQM
jgi:nucleotide-binding universal stress UspA family protein